MREAFLIPGLALLLWAYSRLRRLPWLCRGQWRGWVGFLLLTIFLFSFQPPTTLAFLVVLAGLWLFEPGGRLSWRQALLVVVGLTAALLLVIGILSSLPSLVELSWGRVLFTWLQNNFGYQSHVIERQSGMVQKLLVSLPQALRLPVILAYGAVQPVLPAVLVDPAAWIWRLIGILRSLGWYLLAPILVYGLLATFRGGEQPRHGQRLWLNLVVFSWILLAAANGGGDQWDNPRYRAVFLVFQALLAAWALSWARNGRPELRRTDPWLWRWLGATGLFVLLFLEWYLGRQYPDWLHIDLTVMILVTLGVGGGFLLASWLWDWVRTRRRPGNHT